MIGSGRESGKVGRRVLQGFRALNLSLNSDLDLGTLPLLDKDPRRTAEPHHIGQFSVLLQLRYCKVL